jgi:hypothetical protein
MRIPLAIWDDKSIATTVTESFEIMVDELNALQFQFDTAGDKADLDSVILNLHTEDGQIIGDVPMSDLREIDKTNGGGFTPDDTHSFFEIDLGAYYLGGKKVYGTIYNGDAQTQTVDLQVIHDQGLRPKELIYRKYTSTVFAVSNAVAMYFHGSALDESDETLNLKIGNVERNLKLKNYFINYACYSAIETIDLTFFAFFQSRIAYDMQVTTSADLSTNYIVVCSLADLGNATQVARKKDSAIVSAQKTIAPLSKTSLKTNIVAGTVSSRAETLVRNLN